MFSLTANSVPISVSVVATFQTCYFAAIPNTPISVTVNYSPGIINQYSLLPTGKDVKSSTKILNNQITFSIFAPTKLELRINSAVTVIGDTPLSTVLYIIVDLPEVQNDIPAVNDPEVLYFKPGLHNLGYKVFDINHPAPKRIYVVSTDSC